MFNKNETKFPPKITKKGTELPILSLKGKPYLQAAHRLVWFEEENTAYHISSDFLRLTDDEAIVKTTIIILDEKGNAVRKVSATKRETKNDFPDFVEKCETSSLARALAMLGYGTQFAPELDEGNRLADSPIDIAKKMETTVVAAKSNNTVELSTENATAAVDVTPVSSEAAAPTEDKVARPTFRKSKKAESAKGDLW